VASEVRSLAQRSGDAAKEIGGLINTSVREIECGVSLVGDTSAALDHMLAQVAATNALVNDIAGSAQEQATSLTQVNAAVREMDRLTQRNAERVNQTTSIGQDLFAEVERLAALVATFRVAPPDVAVGPAPLRLSA
jgi:methyl-accepting chemotaxis protein